MTRTHRVVASCALALLSAASVRSREWSLELYGGAAASAPSRLTIRQGDFPDLRFTAHFETRSFESPVYYSGRLGVGTRGGHRWELQLVHHKLHLREPPAEVQSFSITHGFNILSLSRAWERRGWALRLGGGLVLAHPESAVRGRRLSEQEGLLGRGYYLTGPAAQLGAGRRFPLLRGLFLSAEMELAAARARVPVAGGDASMSNVSVHARFGLGHRF